MIKIKYLFVISSTLICSALASNVFAQTSMPNVMIPTPSNVYIWTGTSSSSTTPQGTGNLAVSFATGSNTLFVVNGGGKPNPNDRTTFMCEMTITGYSACQSGAKIYGYGINPGQSTNACGPASPTAMMGLQFGTCSLGLQGASPANGENNGCCTGLQFNYTSNGTGPYFLISVPGMPSSP